IYDIKNGLNIRVEGADFADETPLTGYAGYQTPLQIPDGGARHSTGFANEETWNQAPTGTFTSASYDGTGLNVHYTGSATHPDHPGQAIGVEIITDDLQHVADLTAGASFDATLPMPPAAVGHTVCAWAHDVERYQDTPIGCLLPKSIPFGNLEAVTVRGLNQF